MFPKTYLYPGPTSTLKLKAHQFFQLIADYKRAQHANIIYSPRASFTKADITKLSISINLPSFINSLNFPI